MFRNVLALFLLSSFVAAQQPAKNEPAKPAQPAPNLQGRPAEAAESLPDSAPVITIKNLCTDGSTAPSCSTVITKGQFEHILDSVLPSGMKLPPASKQQIAHQYASLILMSTAAKKAGVTENDPEVQARVELATKSAIAQSYDRRLHEEAKPTDVEIEKYYKDNPSAFEEVTLARLYIPRATPSKSKPADEAAEKAAAEKLRQRAAAGEDLDKLQKEAFTSSGNTGTPPPTQIGPRRRGQGLPPDQETAIFALQPGSVTQLLENPAGWYVYKVISKRQVPLSEVKDEISAKLQQQKYTDERDAINKSVDTQLNTAYFGNAEEGGMPGMPPGMHMHPVPAQTSPQSTPKPPQK
jgi:hypothetical protein